MSFLAFCAFLFTLYKLSQLTTRVRNLEQKVQQTVGMNQNSAQNTSALQQAQTPITAQASPVAQVPAYTYVPRPPSAPERFINWLKEDWLLKAGAGLFLLGFGWLVTFAFMSNLIGPVGRISLCLLAGVSLMSFGWMRMARYFEQGSVFLGLGAGVVLMTLFAARTLYDFFDPISVLGLSFLVSVVIALAGVKYASSGLAVASVLLAGIAPLLTHSATSDFIGLFAYLFVVVLGAVWVVQFTGSRDPIAVALTVVGFYSITYFANGSSGDAERLLLLWVAFVFALIFFGTSLIALVRSPQASKIGADLYIGLGTGLFTYMWTVAVVTKEMQSMVIALMSLIFAVGAYAVFALTGRKEPFFIYAGVATVFLGVATALEFQGPALTIAFIIEASVITLLTYLFTKNTAMTERASFVFLIPVLLSLESFAAPTWNGGVLHSDALVLTLLSIVLGGTGYVLYSLIDTRTETSHAIQTPVALMVGGVLYILSFVWLATHALYPDDFAVMVSLFVYTALGLVLYISGKSRGYPTLQKCGAILLGSVVVRLLFVDVWEMELTGKIVTFFGVGALLMSTAFMGKKSTDVTPQ